VVSVVLAAGAGERFGGLKQLALFQGKPLLAHAIDAALAWPTDATIVVLGSRAAEIEESLDLGGVTVVRCADWAHGSGASLRAGLVALAEDVAAAMIGLGDEPLVPAAAASRLLGARAPGTNALRATYRGRPGHPVLIERPLFASLIDALPDARPGDLLREAGVVAVDCTDLGDPVDIDTPADLVALAERDRGNGDVRPAERPQKQAGAARPATSRTSSSAAAAPRQPS
jgi:CTP:molybdopterin cytidylyltransferase MocA